MSVQELIDILKTLSPNKEVFFETSKPDAKMIRIISVDSVDEMQTADFQQYVVLASAMPFMDLPNGN